MNEKARLDLAVEDVRRVCGIADGSLADVALVLGSGLGSYADELENKKVIPYDEIRGMPVSSVTGHAGNLVLGEAEGVRVAAMQGRVHLYEGINPNDVVFGLRLMIKLGVKSVIITNAAGGIGDDLNVGDLMLISDQINMTGTNVLVGENDPEWGPRFVDMTTAFDKEYRELAKEAADALGIEIKNGVYAGLLGPTYETPAEIRMLKAIGADAVGMSTVHEVIAARHMGIRVLGISCITNKAAGLGHEVLTHDDVKETADKVKEHFISLLGAVLRRIRECEN